MNSARFDRFTRFLAGRSTRRAAVGSTLAGALAGLTSLDRLAAAQPATPSPAATPVPGAKPVFMFVQTARSGRGEVNPHAGTPAATGTPVAATTPVPGGGAPFLLTLEGHTGLTVYFSDRPARVVGASPTAKFLPGLGFSPENPPNAALVAEFKSGHGLVVLKLIEPVYDASSGTVTYGAEPLQGYVGANLAPVTAAEVTERLPADFGSAALFIDDCPDIKLCMKPVPLGYLKVGPIPGGPYGACWQGLLDGCEPCHTTVDYLKGLCNNGYPDECKGRCDISA